jgi:hypothetical protein
MRVTTAACSITFTACCTWHITPAPCICCSPLWLVGKVNEPHLVGDGLGLKGQQHPLAERALQNTTQTVSVAALHL